MNPALHRPRLVVCSSCQGPYKILVTFKGCKHKFCRFCVITFKGESGTATSCPLCHKAPRHGEDKLQGQPGSGADETEKISLEVDKEAEVERVCWEHQVVLDLFCTEDQTPICMSCRDSQVHRAHAVVPIEEAAQEYKIGCRASFSASPCSWQQ
ncbi:E3 ubiquitin-protein ligase TRIM39-like [Gopherus evgoodei]|uniref:E3 ubiquitin-protein ligase TRIM39-like n=1 Tax=Gopherus evgoodei TaxID=1825980 RepID=UPI0011CFAF80|nr:E3 ubiquitin-protein ligase TRIM39-like [Gopherus evgoodei]